MTDFPAVYSLIERYAQLYHEVGRIDLADEILDCLEKIKAQRLEADLKSAQPTALDLYMWRGKELAEVEVKAPNDKLRPGQKETLLFDGWAKRWVVEVEDINPPSLLGTSRISTQLHYKIPTQTENIAAHHKAEYEIQNLATLSDALKGEGLWTDVMKEVVFLATQGKHISKKQKELAEGELSERKDLYEILLAHLPS